MAFLVALNTFQRKLVDIMLAKGDMSIKELSRESGFSNSFIRQNVDIMVAAGELSVDKRRQPFVYDVPAESPEMRTRRSVDKAKGLLRSKDTGENPFVDLVKQATKNRKEMWPEVVPTLRAVAQAIEEMEADGELIDTLEG